MKHDMAECVRSVQEAMVESARPAFSDNDNEALRVVIRLTMEFYDYLQHGKPNVRKSAEGLIPVFADAGVTVDMKNLELDYVCGGIFSGIDFFRSVNSTYSVLMGAVESQIEWGQISPPSLEALFVSKYRYFEEETDFLKKCRLLLDLFRIQVVVAIVSLR